MAKKAKDLWERSPEELQKELWNVMQEKLDERTSKLDDLARKVGASIQYRATGLEEPYKVQNIQEVIKNLAFIKQAQSTSRLVWITFSYSLATWVAVIVALIVK